MGKTQGGLKERMIMRKVKTNRRNRIFGLFAMFAMAIGVGVSLAPREVVSTKAAVETFTITLNNNTLSTSGSYVNDGTSTNYDGGDATLNLDWGSINPKTGQMRGNKTTQTNLQNTGEYNFRIRNTTALPGNVRSITINTSGGTFVAGSIYATTGSDEITNQTTGASTAGTAGTGTVTWNFAGGSGEYFAIGAIKGGTSGTSTATTVVVTYEVGGVAKTLSNIQVTQSGTTDYFVGDVFSLAGFKVKANFSDGSFDDDITPTFDNTPLVLGQTKVTLSYNYGGTTESTDVPITVSTRTLTSIQVTTNPQTTYEVGDEFNPAGMVVKANYSAGNPDTNYTKYSYSPTDAFESAGEKTITIASTENISIKTTLQVNVLKAALSVTLTSDGAGVNMADNTDYAELFGLTGKPFTVYGYKNNASGNVGRYTPDLRFYYGAGGDGSSLEINLTNALYKIRSFEIAFWDRTAKTNVVVDDVPIYNNTPGTKTTVEYTGEGGLPLDASKITIQNVNTDNVQLRIESITINYALESEEQVLTSLTHSGDLAKDDYFADEEFDPTGLVFTAFFDNDPESGTDVSSEVTFNSLTAGDTSVVGSYKFGDVTKTTTITGITVVKRPTLESIEVTKNPDRMTFYQNESFYDLGMEVTAYYSDLESAVVGNYTVSPASFEVLGVNTVTISHEHYGVTKTTTINVNVITAPFPDDLMIDIGDANKGALNKSIEDVTDLMDVIYDATDDELLESATAENKNLFYGGTSHELNGIQPLVIGSSSTKGEIKLTFSDEININTVTLYAARRTDGASKSALLQVVGADEQEVGNKGYIDTMFAPYVFEGGFGNELVIKTNENFATYLYGVDIDYTLVHEDEAMAFANAIMNGVGEGTNPSEEDGKGTCHAALEELEGMYDNLSESALLEFETNDSQLFKDARERLDYLRAWVAANPGPGAPGSVISPNNENAPINATLIIGLLGLTTMAGYYFLSKKEKLVK